PGSRGGWRLTSSAKTWTAAALLVSAALATSGWAALTPMPSDYLPHGHCYLWQPALIDLHVICDALIAFAYAAISLTLGVLVRRSHGALPFNWIFLAFGIFIVACGATHAMEIWTLWHPDYWLSGVVKAVTAVASVATALVLPPLVPRALELARADHLAQERNI